MSSLLCWLLSVFAIGALALYLYGLNLVQRWRFRHLPGPKPAWLLGNLKDVSKNGIQLQRKLWHDEFGPIFVWWIGTVPGISIADPEAARKFLLKANDKKMTLKQVEEDQTRRVNQHMLIFLGAEEARKIRSMWQPMFHSSNLSGFVPTMKEGAARLMARLHRAQREGKEVDMKRLLGDMTMDVVGSTAFGVDLATQKDDSTEGSGVDITTSFSAAVQKVFNGGLSPSAVMKNPLNMLSTLFHFTFPLANQLGKVLRMLDMMPVETKELDTAHRILHNKSLELSRSAVADVSSGQKEAQGAGSFLQHLAMSDKGLDNYQMASQAFVFMLAGYETTANALAFAMYNLARYEEVYDKAAAEVDAYGDKPLEYADLSAFPYLDALIKETLRMYPPVPTTIARFLGSDMELCGYRIPSGCQAVVHTWHMQMNPAVFKEPEQFIPERFIKGSSAHEDFHPYAYLPFGGGSRMCIGVKFAQEEMKLALVHVPRTFKFRLSPGQVPLKISAASTLQPKEGMFGYVTLRSETQST
mmetsp:Transcript_28518/g.73237  ORF Transcript_28518/g.73237 Transcript_28518/m.73237 type:complete len:527 (+) Transcript_28518:1112-2692(+)